MIRAVLFDLDGTLVDSAPIAHLRDARRWRDCAQSLHRTSLYDGVVELIRELEVRQIRWAVVTNVVSNYAYAALRHHGLSCSTVVAYHDVRYCKPHPEGCNKALSALGITPASAVGVGDLASDCQAFIAAGVPAYCAGWNSAAETGGPWTAVLADPRKLIPFL